MLLLTLRRLLGSESHHVPQCVARWCVPQGNGGESRKSFHGYPNGFAQLIDSPETWHITPMQIDSRNRDCGVTPADIHNCSKFTPGPEPKSARYGYGIPKEGTNYSGVIECPCTDNWAVRHPPTRGGAFPGSVAIDVALLYARHVCRARLRSTARRRRRSSCTTTTRPRPRRSAAATACSTRLPSASRP